MPALAAPVRAADLDLNAGVLTYVSIGTTIANQLAVTLTGGTYTIDDPAEPAIALASGAVSAGCVAVTANRITCPAAAAATASAAGSATTSSAARPATTS